MRIKSTVRREHSSSSQWGPRRGTSLCLSFQVFFVLQNSQILGAITLKFFSKNIQVAGNRNCDSRRFCIHVNHCYFLQNEDPETLYEFHEVSLTKVRFPLHSFTQTPFSAFVVISEPTASFILDAASTLWIWDRGERWPG